MHQHPTDTTNYMDWKGMGGWGQAPNHLVHGSLGCRETTTPLCRCPYAPDRTGAGRKARPRQDVDGCVVICVGPMAAGSTLKHCRRWLVDLVRVAADAAGLRCVGGIRLNQGSGLVAKLQLQRLTSWLTETKSLKLRCGQP